VLARAVRWARRHPRWTALILALVHLAVAVPALLPVPHPGGDNATYLALARSILDGGYRDLFDPAAPVHTQYPPGFPLIEAGALAVGLRPWVGLKAVTLAFSALGVALTFLWVRRGRRPGLALGVGVALALSPGVVQLAHWELSDVPFWAITTAALLAWERTRPGQDGRAAAASALTVAAYLTRSAGLPLLVAAGAWLLWRRRWRHLAILAAVAVPAAGAWWLWGRAGPGYASFLLLDNPYDPASGSIGVAGIPARMGENLLVYHLRFLPVLLTGREGGAGAALAVGVSALALYGWARRLRRPDVAALWLPLYAGVVLAWNPVWSGERLILPLFPLLLVYAGDGLTRLARAVRAAPPRAVGAAAAAALVLAGLPGLYAEVRTGLGCTARYRAGERYACFNAEWTDFMETARVAGRVLPPGSVVLSRKPALFWAESGMRGRTYPLAREPDSLFAAARRAGARYVVVDAVDAVATRYLTPVLMRRPEAFCVVHAPGPDRAALLGIRAGAASARDLGDPGEAEREVGFARCGPEYYRSAAVRDSLAGL
jgi:hypothetical protein